MSSHEHGSVFTADGSGGWSEETFSCSVLVGHVKKGDCLIMYLLCPSASCIFMLLLRCVCVCVLSTIQVISGIINILRQVVDNESNVVLCY